MERKINPSPLQQAIQQSVKTDTSPLQPQFKNDTASLQQAIQQAIRPDPYPTQQVVKNDPYPSQQVAKTDTYSSQQVVKNDPYSSQQVVKTDPYSIKSDPYSSQAVNKSDPYSSQAGYKSDPYYSKQQLVKTAVEPLRQLIRGDNRNTYISSDDNVIMRQIVGTHSPDGLILDVKPLLLIVEDILHLASIDTDGNSPAGRKLVEDVEDRTNQSGFLTLVEALAPTIERLGCEINCKRLGDGDAHSTSVLLFNMLTTYPWDAKVVLTLAAFALTYGEFWLLAQIYPSNKLARSMAIVKQVPNAVHSENLKRRFDALNELLKAILELTRIIVDLNEIPTVYFADELSPLATAKALIPTAAYWIFRSVVASAAQINSIGIASHHEYLGSTTESWELSTLHHKIVTIIQHLKDQLALCLKHIGQRKEDEFYKFLHDLFKTSHSDVRVVMEPLIHGQAKDIQSPLIEGTTKRRVNVDTLRRKNVLLLISNLNISPEELLILEQIYTESRTHSNRIDNHYELVWLPIVDHTVQFTDPLQKQFDTLQSTMPWHSVHHPSVVDRVVARFIRDKWNFKNRPILVVLDPQGRVLCENAIHMMWIWGSNAFPFTSLKEEALWREESWRLELLVNGIDPAILNWIRDDKYIFLYGGDDIEWIRKFTDAARKVAQAESLPLEMVYVGRSNKKEHVRRTINIINQEKLGYCWQDLTMIWFFWTRIECMLFSKIQQINADDNDPVTQEVKKLLCYDRDGAWAVFCKGSTILATGHGSTILVALNDYAKWKGDIATKKFHGALVDYHEPIHTSSQPCYRFDIPFDAGTHPAKLKCPECLRMMEKLCSFKCCHTDEGLPGVLFH